LNKDDYKNKKSMYSLQTKDYSEIEKEIDKIIKNEKGESFIKDMEEKDKKYQIKRTSFENLNVDKILTEQQQKDFLIKNVSNLDSEDYFEKADIEDTKELFQQIKTANNLELDDKKKDYQITSPPLPTQQTKEIPKQKKFFRKILGDKKVKESKNKTKGFFSKKSSTKSIKNNKETDIEYDKKTLKKHFKREKIQHLDEFVENLTSDEAKWLDQQIKTADNLELDDKKKDYQITSPPLPTQQTKEIPKQKKFLKRFLGNKKRKENKKGIITPFQNIYTPEKKSFKLSKNVTKNKKATITPEQKRASFEDNLNNYSSGEKTNINATKSTINKVNVNFNNVSTEVKEYSLKNIISGDEVHFFDEAQDLKFNTIKNLGYSEGSWEELDFYPLQEPFAYVEIIREKDTLDKRYILVEVGLSEREGQIIDFIKETLTGFSINTTDLDQTGERKYLIEKIEQILDDYMIIIDEKLKNKIVYFLEKQFLGLHKLEVLMRDPNIEDISCDGSGVPIFLYHRKYGSLKGSIQFDDEDELSAFVIKLAQKCGKHISIAEPMLDATMPDGSRIQMTLSTEVTTKGSTFTIRKFKEDPFSPPDLIEFNTMSSEMIAYMWMAVENGINALIAGGTAAGKTSTLNALSLFIPRESKIVSIEETREINLPHPNWIPGVSRSGFGEVVGNKVIGEIDLYDLMKAALRQRPEYILVGEIRGREAYVLFQAMSTGHTTYSTVHADSAQSLIHRLEGKPINIPRIMLQALDIVCIQVISRIKNKRARRVKQIIEIIDIDPSTKEILTNEVFRWDPVEDKFIYSGKSYILERIRAEKDKSREEMTNEIKNRAKLLEWMNKNNIREFKKVATLISQYFENPERTMAKIKVNS